jgi:genome maintenance exonuclease 1
VNGLRHYVTPEGKVYPSVTSVVGLKTSESLKEWKEDPQNQAKSEMALQVGEFLHGIVESVATNREWTIKDPPAVIKNPFFFEATLKSFFKNNIDEVVLSESCLWSDALQLAGRIDLLVRTKGGVLTVLDFKFPAKEKQERYIEHYFLQTTAYALMIQERYGIMPKEVHLAIFPWQTLSLQVYKKPTKDYIDPLVQSIRYYRNQMNAH